MRGFIATVLLTGLWAASAVGLHLTSPRDVSPAVVRFEIEREDVWDPLTRDALRKRSPLRKRQKTVTETLDNQQTLYFANVTVGTPSQKIKLHIDTGSSDMWVNTPRSALCQYRKGPCSDSGTYNANASSTSKYVSSNFNVSYVDGSGSTGDYVTDNVAIGGTTLNGLQFGVGYFSSTPEGILGIGYQNDEGVLQRGGKSYSNAPMAMVDAGLIQSNAYSIWLDDLQASTGSILFGGVDTGKFHGSLQTLPVQKELNQFIKFIVTLTGLNLLNGGQSTNIATGLPAPVILDTGSSITYLPDSLAQNVFKALNVQFNANEGAGYASCDLVNQNISLAFAFSSLTITVPISELIINPANADTGNGQSYQTQDQLCLFGISSAQGNQAVLGDTFLRSAYVVFDLANNQVSMAQTNFNSTTTSVQEIGTGANSVPSASGVANPVQADVSATGGSRIGPATSTSTAGKSAAAAVMPPPLLLTQLVLVGLALVAGAFV